MIINANENRILTIKEGGTGANEALEALMNLGGISVKKLWENASPTSSFGEQTITVSGLNDYDQYEIECAYYIDLVSISVVKSTVGKGTLINKNDSGSVMRRNVTASNDKLTFSSVAGTKIQNGFPSITDNRYLIPIAIYGIKGVK